MEIYLDNAATTRPLDTLLALTADYMQEGWHNPSSLYRPAAAAHKRLQEARVYLLKALGAAKGSLYFTSGGTEANNWALNASPRRGRHIVSSQIEHPSVYAALQEMAQQGYRVDFVRPGDGYAVDAGDVAAAVRPDTALVSVMHVNNETGAISDIAGIASAVKRANPQVVFHSDGVQAFLKIPFSVSGTTADLYTVSAHKIHAFKGAGALYAASAVQPLLVGGMQEGRRRAGTENTLGILAFHAAAKAFREGFPDAAQRMQALRRRMSSGVLRMPDAHLNSAPEEKSAPHILNVSFPGVRGEVLMHALEQEGVYIGTGSACSSRKQTGSRVLAAAGLDGDRVLGAVRLSFSPFNAEEEVDRALEIIETQVRRLRRLTAR